MDKEIFDLRKIANSKCKNEMGNYVCMLPTQSPILEQEDNKGEEVNYTGAPGKASGLYYSLFFQLPKWGWTVAKADEWIEVSPTHKEYYDRTVSTKQALEATIKTGLASAAQAVADFELMNHDIRKYKEILGYFNEKDEHSLKAMFIDQVDVHTDSPGQPVSMRSIAPRWPTIIADFMRLDDDDIDPKKVQDKLNISKAEAVILVTKNKLYKGWKNDILEISQNRYEMLKGQVEARKKTIEEYKEWLKPYLARFKMTKLGNERPGVRRGNVELFADIAGISTFGNYIRLFAWKVLKSSDFRKPAGELKGGFEVYPYDDYVREHLILGLHGDKNYLAKIYPWLKYPMKYCPKCSEYLHPSATVCKCGSLRLEEKTKADEIVEKTILPGWNGNRGLDPYELYYLFEDFDVMRVGTRLPSGELEDITFTISTAVVSQNILLLKLLELECRAMELEHYMDNMLGYKVDSQSVAESIKDEYPKLFPKKKLSPSQEYVMNLHKSIAAWGNPLEGLSLSTPKGFRFFKPGSYEKDFKERVSKNYSTVAGSNFGAIIDFLKSRMGVPK